MDLDRNGSCLGSEYRMLIDNLASGLLPAFKRCRMISGLNQIFFYMFQILIGDDWKLLDQELVRNVARELNKV